LCWPLMRHYGYTLAREADGSSPVSGRLAS
jgi:hypothetical protein